ncbi:MAG: hypothetical protein QQW96_12580 [Tychonema bourrellyi B0820]|uniref:Uncharacterized protein n=1 Tax=Tychonema bourrellyi FEM_GT703 TaxID=2040638 RepID=A0A2G4F2E4_9CYAN|nr:hypothetical protein [Tychonema bourrellyi]MDQ2098469.1 hypothetical protein [Tychonema bourrellyi B0820]PHX55919.1 hypothetical protein CP500_008055 [Tychonema bourrellyi FEM_GT703]
MGHRAWGIGHLLFFITTVNSQQSTVNSQQLTARSNSQIFPCPILEYILRKKNTLHKNLLATPINK